MADVSILTCTLIFDLIILVYFIFTHKSYKGHVKVFLVLFASIVISTACSLTSSCFDHYPVVPEKLVIIPYTADFFYFVFHNILPFMYCVYVMIVDGRGLRMKKISFLFFLAPIVIAEILSLLTPFMNLVFYYDENGHFARGPYEIVIYAAAGIYVGIAIYYMIRYRNALTTKNNIVLWMFFGSAFIGVVIQMLRKEMKVELFAESLALLGLIFTIENEVELLDPASKVYNRQAFYIDSRKFITTRDEYAVITLNITDFRLYAKMLSYGKTAAVLDTLINWLNGLNSEITIYRISTTKFALICLYEDKAEVDVIVDAIKARFDEGWTHGGVDIDFNVLIGVAFVPAEIDNPDKLLMFAQENLKDRGDGVFRGEDLVAFDRKGRVEIALRRAIDNKAFKVYYQPIWCVEDEKFHTAEALVRLEDKNLGFIPPDEFIGIAEETGLISQIGLIVFEDVCRFIRDNAQKLGIEYIEINLSLYQLLNSNISEEFSAIMKKYGVKPSQINLELTETVSPDLSNTVAESIDKIRNLGISFSLDDYGTGYSNLQYLVKMDFANIKIDKFLLWNAVKSDSSAIIFRDSSGLMRKLGMDVIQEGVEDKEQLDMSIAAGASYIQGYYFSKPLPEEQYIAFLQQ
ncbi:MAG: GGDEF domain-containing phosphodiesterase [Saccharofermentans sp.]|nr:GGDEF domain-containing phosphodiesterase [Saccharofermentans sp.]